MSSQQKARKRTKRSQKQNPTVVVVAAPKRKTPNARAKRDARRRQMNAGLPVTITGRGGYFSDSGQSLGSWLGGQGGKAAGSILDTVFGLGAYNVKSNSLLSMQNVRYSPGGPPRVVNSKKGEATVFTHREYVGELITGENDPSSGLSAYKIQSFPINPGNSSLFPWLSLSAGGFQEYEIQGMLVDLVSEASTFAQNLALGTIMMAAEYNPVALPPANKVALLELEYSSSCKTSESLIMPIECARVNDSETHLFIALDNDYLGTDARTFNLGEIYVATQGAPAETAKVAEIWVTYQIALFKPKIPSLMGTTFGAHWQLSGCGNGAVFGTSQTISANSTPGFSLDVPNSSIVFPQGDYTWLVNVVFVRPAGTAAAGGQSFVPGNGTLLTLYPNNGFGHNSSTFFACSDNVNMSQTCTFKCNGTGTGKLGVTVVTFGSVVANSFGDIYVTRWPSAITD